MAEPALPTSSAQLPQEDSREGRLRFPHPGKKHRVWGGAFLERQESSQAPPPHGVKTAHCELHKRCRDVPWGSWWQHPVLCCSGKQ